LAEAGFTYRVTDGWIRDLASQPTPDDPWPCLRWDEELLADQIRFLEVQRELGVDHNVVWGLFVDRAWPVPFRDVISPARETRLQAFVAAAQSRGVKVLSGVGVYSWGFEEVIRRVPGVSVGHGQAMCAFSEEAWDWQRRVLDFLMDPRWGLGGISMQSADQGRCECEKCRAFSAAEHHAELLVRCARYVREQRPDWVIGTAAWGLRVDDPEDRDHLRFVSEHVDYLVEVRERSAEAGLRPQLAADLACAFGSVGGVFVEPPQHWERLRWFLPCGLGSAQSLAALWADGGRACEYFYRPFANPVEEVSWRTGARALSSPSTPPETALAEAVGAVYGATGEAQAALTDWFARGERAYFSRSDFRVGEGPVSLEPLIWSENPAVPGPPVYLTRRMTPEARVEYARELGELRAELLAMDLPNEEAAAKTAAALEGTLRELATLE
jgi:hypothetical protein